MNFGNLRKLTIPTGVFILLFLGCISEYENYTPYEKSIGSFFDKVQTLDDTFNFEAEDGFSFTTDRQTVVTIPSNAFVDALGNNIVGTVDLTFVELLDKSLMMLYNKPTISNQNILESAGVFYLEASKNEERLKLNKPVEVSVISENTNEMQLFFWGTNTLPSNDEDSWIPFENNTIEITDTGYNLSFERLDWINCDRFLNLPENELTSACLNMVEAYNTTNTICYLVFEDLNSVIRMEDVNQDGSYCFPGDKAPIGEKVSFVAISVRDEDQYELGTIENVVLSENHEQEIQMESKTLEQILDILAEF